MPLDNLGQSGAPPPPPAVYHVILFIKYSDVHPSKEVTQHDSDRSYFFYPGFIFIKLGIPENPVYLHFDWCLICSDCFTGARAGWVNLGQCQKGKVAKCIGLYRKCMLCQVLSFSFVSVCTRTHCPFIAPNSSDTFGGFRISTRTHCSFIAPKSSDTFGGFRRNKWAVGTRAYTHKRKAQNLT